MSEPEEERPRGVFGRLGELFEASALGLVTLLLLGASFFATWRGMGDFLTSRDLGAGAASQGLVLLIVATLSLAMYVALREMIAPYYVRGWWSAIWKRVVAGVLYAVLALWSVGFGYGFWWSLVAGQDATETSLQQSVASVRAETSDVRARLAAAASVMAGAQALSDLKAEQEAARGGTCGVSSPAGAGPLARARDETQTQIAVLATRVREDWQGPLSAQLAALEAGLESALGNGAVVGEGRKAAFEALGQKTQTAAREIGADATARGRTIAAQLRAKAAQLSAPPEGGRVTYCYDLDLAASLNAAADELDQTFSLEVAPFRFAEGADGVARAIEDLISRAGTLAGVRGAPKQAALVGRDLIALLAAIGVDLALFVFALLRGSGGRARHRPERARELAPEDAPIIMASLTGPAQKALAAPGTAEIDKAEDDRGQAYIEAEFEEIGTGQMVKTFDPGSQLEESDHIADLLSRVQSLMAGVAAATLAAERAPLQNKLSDTLREMRKLGYFDTGSSDKYYKAALHAVISLQPSDKEAGYILQILRPGFLDAEGRLREKALVIVSSGPEEA